MRHAIQVLNCEKRKLINRLYEMKEENDFGKAQHTDEDFRAVRRKIAQTDKAIKLIETAYREYNNSNSEIREE